MANTKPWSVYCIYWQPLFTAKMTEKAEKSPKQTRKGKDASEGNNTSIKPHILKKDGTVAKSRPNLRTYVGITNNTARRLRQHNGEIVGGAKYTTRTKGGVWRFLYIISGFPDGSTAAKWEWRLHRKGKRLNTCCTTCNRVAVLRKTVKMERVTERAPLNTTLTLQHRFPEGEPPLLIPRTSCVCFLNR